MELTLPGYVVENKIHNQKFFCRIFQDNVENFDVSEYHRESRRSILEGYKLTNADKTVLIIKGDKKKFKIENFEYVLQYQGQPTEDLQEIVSNSKWVEHPLLQRNYFCEEYIQETLDNRESSKFNYQEETDTTLGLRGPQIGGIYAALSHRTVSKEPANIVMPTGTGKTECMLSIVLAKKCNKVLITVPSDALREQTTLKFVNLGILREIGVIDTNILNPVVCQLIHKPRNTEELQEILTKSQIIITTMHIATRMNDDLQEILTNTIDYFFIDEAHHIGADTRGEIRKKFIANDKLVLQFTATPFRNDKKNISGKAIYTYPLSKAQEEGYFKRIEFDTVFCYNTQEADRQIAEKAIQKLKADRENGLDHILMARAETKGRANEIAQYYLEYRGFNPILVYTGVDGESSKVISKRIEAIKNGDHKIVICVGMLGEGFDLPNLKICALHDAHKSLPIILQFTGRFTRSSRGNDIGDAYIVANIANSEIENNIEELFSQDADWNRLLNIRSAEETQKFIDFNRLMEGFRDFPEISIQNIYPKLSAVVYKTKTPIWTSTIFTKFIKDKYEYYNINEEEHIIILIKKLDEKIAWGNIKELRHIDYELTVLYFDTKTGLLYINSSNNGSLYLQLAQHLIENPVLLNGEKAFRALHNINRVILHNIGLLSAVRGPLRYTMYTGLDVMNGLTSQQTTRKIQSNLFGVGYESGERVSIGVSYKGRIWSMKAGNILDFINWCKKYGPKLIDENITQTEFLKGVLKPTDISALPKNLSPLWIERPEIIYLNTDRLQISIGGNTHFLYELDLVLDYSYQGPGIRFRIEGELSFVDIVFTLDEQGFSYEIQDEKTASIVVSATNNMPLENWFQENPPRIYFNDTSFVENNKYLSLGDIADVPMFSLDGINTSIEWKSITEEIQGFEGEEKNENSIQSVMFDFLKEQNYDILFNDDGSGEIADIIAMKKTNERIIIELFHCKYSSETEPGHRVNDLYEVCGQATKSIKWKHNKFKIFDQMFHREGKRNQRHLSSFEVGDSRLLDEIRRMANKLDIEMKIHIVQPGLSKTNITNPLLEVLGATELYLKEVGNANFYVWSSP